MMNDIATIPPEAILPPAGLVIVIIVICVRRVRARLTVTLGFNTII